VFLDSRRRLERDLHDGIQQRLVSLALKAQMIETMTPRPADQIQDELSRLASGLGTALDELREISHGIHPALLSESGLGPALEALARRSAVPVELDLNLGPRLDEHIEAAGYYIASEARPARELPCTSSFRPIRWPRPRGRTVPP
jgi:signal transduction histidine kinase